MLVPTFLISCDKDDNNDPTTDNDDPAVSDNPDKYDPYPYEDLSVFMELPEFTDLVAKEEDIEDFIFSDISDMLSSENLYVQVFEGTVQKWKKTVIDFVGVVDGEVFSGGTAQNYTLIVGSGTFVPGFEEGMIGMEIGEVRPITFNFPDNYYEELAGKEVTFTVTLNELYEFPEITDEFVKEYTFCKTVDEFWSTLKDEYIQNFAFNTLLERCELKKLPDEYTEYYQAFISHFASYSNEYGVTLENFVSTYGMYFQSYGLWSGMSLDDFYNVAKNYAESNVANDLLMYSVIRKYDLKTEGAAYNEAKEQLLRSYEGLTIADLEAEYGKTVVITSIMQIQMMKKLAEFVTVE